MAKCVGADVARVTAWAIVGSVMLAGEGSRCFATICHAAAEQ
jgi:hypothetical protein